MKGKRFTEEQIIGVLRESEAGAATKELCRRHGWLMQKSGSLWGSVLFHAGADLMIILPIFGSYGAT